MKLFADFINESNDLLHKKLTTELAQLNINISFLKTKYAENEGNEIFTHSKNAIQDIIDELEQLNKNTDKQLTAIRKLRK